MQLLGHLQILQKLLCYCFTKNVKVVVKFKHSAVFSRICFCHDLRAFCVNFVTSKHRSRKSFDKYHVCIHCVFSNEDINKTAPQETRSVRRTDLIITQFPNMQLHRASLIQADFSLISHPFDLKSKCSDLSSTWIFWDNCSTRPSPINSDITEAGFDVITTLSLNTHTYTAYIIRMHATSIGQSSMWSWTLRTTELI